MRFEPWREFRSETAEAKSSVAQGSIPGVPNPLRGAMNLRRGPHPAKSRKPFAARAPRRHRPSGEQLDAGLPRPSLVM